MLWDLSKNQLTGTAMKPQRNRFFRQFNKDQYCTDNDAYFQEEILFLLFPPLQSEEIKTTKSGQGSI